MHGLSRIFLLKHARAILVEVLTYVDEDSTNPIRTFVETRRQVIEDRLKCWSESSQGPGLTDRLQRWIMY